MSSMRCYKIFNILIISSLCAISACSSPAEIVIKPNRYGTAEEQVAYHQQEIKKYRIAIKKEEANEKRYLSSEQMNEVRQAMSRKFQYMNKINEHAKAIEELQNQI